MELLVEDNSILYNSYKIMIKVIIGYEEYYYHNGP